MTVSVIDHSTEDTAPLATINVPLISHAQLLLVPETGDRSTVEGGAATRGGLKRSPFATATLKVWGEG